MKTSRLLTLLTGLIALDTAFVLLNDNWDLVWIPIPFAVVLFISFQQAVPRVPPGRTWKVQRWGITAVCACVLVVSLVSLNKTRGERDFIYPRAWVKQIEDCKAIYGRCPAMQDLPPMDAAHPLVSYQSDGQSYHFTVSIGHFFPKLWAYDSKTKEWTKEMAAL